MTSDDRVRALGPFIDLPPVSGGDIHQAFCGTTASGQRLFIKTHSNPPPGIFQAEADGSRRWLPSTSGCAQRWSVWKRTLVLEWLDFAHQPPGRALGERWRSTERLPSASAAKRATTRDPAAAPTALLDLVRALP